MTHVDQFEYLSFPLNPEIRRQLERLSGVFKKTDKNTDGMVVCRYCRKKAFFTEMSEEITKCGVKRYSHPDCLTKKVIEKDKKSREIVSKKKEKSRQKKRKIAGKV